MVSARAKDAGSRLSAPGRRRGGSNLSRKSIFDLHRKAWEQKQKKVEDAKTEAKKAKSAQVQRVHNKKANKLFDRDALHAVQEGLEEAIRSLGEAVTPLSLFFSAFTTLSRSPENSQQVPYLLTIVAACAPRLSQGLLLRQMESAFQVAEQLISMYMTTNHLITTKAMKMVQSFLLAVEVPTMDIVKKLEHLQPSKLQGDLVALYLITFRKLLEQCALGSFAAADPSQQAPLTAKKNVETGFFPLNQRQLFYTKAVPHFTDVCLAYMTDSPIPVATSALQELSELFVRSLSPTIVESAEGQPMIDALLSHQLLSLLKPVYQNYWPMSAQLLERFFTRINYLKRLLPTPFQEPFAGDQRQRELQQVKSKVGRNFTSRFPASVFMLKVLNKLRVMDDTQLNGPVERAMVALGSGMMVEEFVSILPFDPQEAAEKESLVLGQPQDITAVWSLSYTLNIIRRIASHDSLPFFVRYFFPKIQYCSKAAAEAEREHKAEAHAHWSALITQYWRVAAAFCHYPVEVNNDSFREMAKQLVGLLGQPLFVDTSATAIHVLCSGYYALANEEQEQEEEEEEDEEGSTAASRAADPFLDDSNGNRPAKAAGEKPNEEMKKHLLHKDALESDVYYLAFTDPGWNPHRYHNISQGYAKHVCEAIFGKYSVNIMPKLCNVFEHHNSTAVLQAIQSFSMVCKADVMTNILKGILEVGQSIAAEEGDARALGLAREKAGDVPLTSKRRMVLDIACAVVAQLPPEYIQALFNDIVEPVLMDPAPESRLLQKKAYKLLFSMFEYRVKDIFPFFSRIVGLLSVGRQHVTISGIKMRLKCLSWALDACKMYYPDQVISTISSLLGEIIIFSRELSSDTRIMAMDVLEKMQHYMLQAGAPANALLRLAVAGLSGKTPQMVSSAVVCLAKLVYLAHEQIPQSDLDASVRLCFQLMESSHAEVRSAASIFARMALKLSKRSPAVRTALERGLQKLLFAIALITSQPHVPSKTRVQMRVLVEKCIQCFSIDHLEKIFPIGSKNFLRYCNKMMRREEKKAERELARRDRRDANEFDKLFLGVGMEAGDEDAAEEDLLEAGALNSFVSKHTTPHMLGPKLRKDGDDDEDEDDTMHLDVQQDGKLRLLSTEEKKTEDDNRQRQAMVQRLLGRANTMANIDTLNAPADSRPGKRGRSEAEDLENDELVRRFGTRTADEAAKKASEAFNRRHPNTVGGADGAPAPSDTRLAKDWYRKAERREEKRVRVEEDIRKGEEFKGTGAGDIRKGNIEPYAYVPLNRRYMNRRHARQAVHRFQIVSHKQLKGEKAKALDALNKKKKK